MSDEPLELAIAIGERLCREAIWDGDRATWLGDEKVPLGDDWEVVHASIGGDLYGGTAGVALFLVRLWGQEPRDETRRAAEGGLAYARAWARRRLLDGSLYSGLAGVAAVTAEAAERFEDARLEDEARGLARQTLEYQPEGAADLISGSAGKIIALLELGRRLEMPEATDAALRLGRELVGRARGDPYPGLSWPSDARDKAPLCGLGHGASGIGFALGELWLESGDASFLDAAFAAAEFERAWFQREQLNWPDLREVDRASIASGKAPPFPAFWCHGAIGIGLARLRLFELTGERILAAEAEAAIQRAEKGLAELAARGGPVDLSLCHGLAAIAELFVAAGHVFEDPYFQGRAAACARLAAEIGNRGAGPWPSGVPEGGENPSLLLGFSGTAMMFLRVADPHTAPVGLLYTRPVVHERVIVQLRSQVAPSEYAPVARLLLDMVKGGRIERISPRGRVLLWLAAGQSANEVAARLTGLDQVEYAEPDMLDHEAAADPDHVS